MKRRELPSIEYLRKNFRYDPESGHVFHACDKAGVKRKDTIAGCLRHQGYIGITIRINDKPIQWAAHRIAWALVYGECPAELEIDHINGNRSDNRLANLRLATRRQNLANARRINRSLPQGVSYRSNGFFARIMFSGERITLGPFASADEAASAYIRAAVEHHGQFARVP